MEAANQPTGDLSTAEARLPGRPANTRTVMALLAGFAAVVLGPWIWFATAADDPGSRMAFGVRTAIAGWEFLNEPVPPAAQETLATTNLFNGRFRGPDARVVTVFAAEWHTGSSRSMSVVQHTPDICWVGAGWVLVDAGQPDQVALEVGGKAVDFQCRAFAGPGGGHRELVVWCTLVGGRILPESERWQQEGSGGVGRRERFEAAYRRVAMGHFLSNVRLRRLGTGDKQFVRFSVPLRGNWAESLADLQRFASLWLSLEASGGGRMPPASG
jgi:hypothetical protein